MDVYERVAELHPPSVDKFVFLTGGAFTRRAEDFLRLVKNPRLEKPFRSGEAYGRPGFRAGGPAMKWRQWVARAVMLSAAIGVFTACNAERQQECQKLLSTFKSLDQAPPNAEAVGRMHDTLSAASFQDVPLREYSKNAIATLAVLANTLVLQGDPSAPDGTTAVVETKLREARGERDDVARYCSE